MFCAGKTKWEAQRLEIAVSLYNDKKASPLVIANYLETRQYFPASPIKYYHKLFL